MRTLGLDRSNATPDNLKAKFKELAKKWHPDRHQGTSKVAAEAKFKELQSAYQLLSGPQGVTLPTMQRLFVELNALAV